MIWITVMKELISEAKYDEDLLVNNYNNILYYT